MKWPMTYYARTEWDEWFAWKPVDCIGTKSTVWLETVERRFVRYPRISFDPYGPLGYWEYRELKHAILI